MLRKGDARFAGANTGAGNSSRIFVPLEQLPKYKSTLEERWRFLEKIFGPELGSCVVVRWCTFLVCMCALLLWMKVMM